MRKGRCLRHWYLHVSNKSLLSVELKSRGNLVSCFFWEVWCTSLLLCFFVSCYEVQWQGSEVELTFALKIAKHLAKKGFILLLVIKQSGVDSL